MSSGFKSHHWSDQSGMPTGGCTFGTGFNISWQNGPLGQGPDRKEPNGAFVEDIIDAAKDRLDYYQQGRFACEENAHAIEYLVLALDALDRRTARRLRAGTEGTHQADGSK